MARPDADPSFTIGQLSKRTGCNIETIRYYERVALMPEPARSAGGHRIYDGNLLKRLGFIRRSRELGLSIGQIRELLALVDGGDLTCAEVKGVTLDHLEDVRRKLADLRKIERVLNDMAKACAGETTPDCTIIEALYSGSDAAKR